jgi:hypothetical protein
MRAQDRQPDPTPVVGTQVKSAGTDESMARGDVPSETDESAARAGEQPESEGSTARVKSFRFVLLLSIIGLLLSIIGILQSFAAPFRGVTWEHKANKEIRDDLKAFDEMRSLSAADKQRLKPRINELLETQRPFLRSEAAVQAIANWVTWVLCICAVTVPAVVVGLTTPDGGVAVVNYIMMLLGVVVLLVLWPARVLQMMTRRTRPGVIWMALILWAYIAVAAWIVTGHGSSDPTDKILVAVVCAVTALTIVLVARVFIVAWNEIALTHAWAERRLEAAVVCILLGVIQVLAEKTGKHGAPTLHVVRVFLEEPDEDDVPTPLQRSGRARALLAQAALTVNEYLPRLIDGGNAYCANAQSTASEAAAALLDLRSAVNLPGGRMIEGDLARLTATIRAWSIGSLADLPRKVPLTADSLESSSRRSGLLQVVRKLLLGALPLILLVAITLLPVTMPTAVTAALAPFAVTWLLLSIASIFSPADVKMDFKTLFNR